MIPQFQLPTDNLYKFICLLFFTLFVTSLIAPEYLKAKIKMELIEIEGKSRGLVDKLDNSSSQVGLMNSILKSQHSRMLLRNSILMDSLDKKLNELDSKENVTKEEIKEVKKTIC